MCLRFSATGAPCAIIGYCTTDQCRRSLRHPTHIPNPIPASTAPVSFFRSVIGTNRGCCSLTSITPTGTAHASRARTRTVAIHYFCHWNDRLSVCRDRFAVDRLNTRLPKNTFLQGLQKSHTAHGRTSFHGNIIPLGSGFVVF